MVDIRYQIRTKSPLHTGGLVTYGTLVGLRRIGMISQAPQVYESRLTEQQVVDATVIVCDWLYRMIPDKQRDRAGTRLWDEVFTNFFNAATAQNKRRFFSRCCELWQVSKVKYFKVAQQAFNLLSDIELLDTVRSELPYIVSQIRSLHHASSEEGNEYANYAGFLDAAEKSEPKQKTCVRVNIPYISGNTFRGIMRQALMRDFVKQVGLDTGSGIAARPYYILLSGGSPLEKRKGVKESTSGAVEAIGTQQEMIRMCPPLDVLGASAVNALIKGYANVGFAFPRCRECGSAEPSFWELLDMVFQVHKDQGKDERDINILRDDNDPMPVVQMFYSYEVFVKGTIFDHRVMLNTDKSLAVSCFYRMLELYKEAGIIGAKAGVGNGEVEFTGLDIPENASAEYLQYLHDNAPAIKEYWENILL